MSASASENDDEIEPMVEEPFVLLRQQVRTHPRAHANSTVTHSLCVRAAVRALSCVLWSSERLPI